MGNNMMNHKRKKNIFFYADDEAELYDELSPLTDPTYDLLHKTLVSQFAAWIDYARSKNFLSDEFLVLDIGCGTGVEALGLLNENNKLRIVGVDISANMLKQFRQKLATTPQKEVDSSRCILVEADILDSYWYESVHSKCDSLGWTKNFEAIVSVYTLHHFSSKMKREFYKKIYDQLPPGGVFINADLFSFDTPWLAKMAQLSVESWIENQFDQASANSNEYSVKDLSEWKALSKHWLEHVRTENNPLPAIAAQKTEITNGDRDSDLLIEVGFKAVECTFRYGQSAILWAFKGDN